MFAAELVLSDGAVETLAAVIAVPLFGLLLAGLVLIIRDTIRGRGRWGINTKPVVCKKCGTPAPRVRKPTSFQQALWGGWTCAECGFEVDKWGEPLPDQPDPAKWKLLEAAEAAETEEAVEEADSPPTAARPPGPVEKRARRKHHD